MKQLNDISAIPKNITLSAAAIVRKYWRIRIRRRAFHSAALIDTLSLPFVLNFITSITATTFIALFMPTQAYKSHWVITTIAAAWAIVILLTIAITLWTAKRYRQRTKAKG